MVGGGGGEGGRGRKIGEARTVQKKGRFTQAPLIPERTKPLRSVRWGREEDSQAPIKLRIEPKPSARPEKTGKEEGHATLIALTASAFYTSVIKRRSKYPRKWSLGGRTSLGGEKLVEPA